MARPECNELRAYHKSYYFGTFTDDNNEDGVTLTAAAVRFWFWLTAEPVVDPNAWERSIINVFTDNLVSEIEHQIIWACHIIVFVLFLSSFVLLVFMSYNIVFTFIKVYSCFAEVWSNMTIKLITGKRKPSGPNLRIKDQSIVKRHLLENWKLHVVLYWIDKDWPASPIKNINIRSLCLAAFFPCHIRNKQWNPCKE